MLASICSRLLTKQGLTLKVWNAQKAGQVGEKYYLIFSSL